MYKAMERQDGDPRLWLERWICEKRLEGTDRVTHELRSLTEVLYLSGSVDQFNMGGLHGIEVFCRQIVAIVEAYATPGRPTWEHARFYAGVPATEEVVAPALRSQVLRRAKEEAELATARGRAVQRSSAADAEDGGAGGGAGGNRKQPGRGPGRGRGRGDPPRLTGESYGLGWGTARPQPAVSRAGHGRSCS